jgi:hypothetical protein
MASTTTTIAQPERTACVKAIAEVQIITNQFPPMGASGSVNLRTRSDQQTFAAGCLLLPRRSVRTPELVTRYFRPVAKRLPLQSRIGLYFTGGLVKGQDLQQ